MKSIIIVVVIQLLMLSNIVFASDNIDIYYDNELLEFEDQGPTIVDSRMLIPVRTALHLGFAVTWDGQEQSILVSNEDKSLKFYIDSPYVYGEDQILIMDTHASIINGRTMIPLRALSDGFEMSLEHSFDTGRHIVRMSNYESFAFHKAIVLGPEGIADGVFNDQIFRSLEVDPLDDNIVIVGTEANGMFKSVDGGHTWNWYREGLLVNKQPGFEYPEFYDISISADRDVYYAAFASSPGPAEGDFPSAFSGIYVSENAGRSWERRVSGLSSGTVSAIISHPTQSHIAYAGVRAGTPSFTKGGYTPEFYDGGIYKTEDFGKTWSKISPSGKADTSDYYRMKTFGEDTVFVMAMYFTDHSQAAGLMRSDDSGETWSVLNPEGIYFGDFDNYDEDIIYALSDDKGTPKGIYKTVDGGKSWIKTSADGYGAIRVSPFDPNLVAYSSRDKLYISTNGLKTSKMVLQYDTSVDKAIITDIVFSKTDENVMYAGGPGLRIYKSTDKGQSFVKVANLREKINAYLEMENGLYKSHLENLLDTDTGSNQ